MNKEDITEILFKYSELEEAYNKIFSQLHNVIGTTRTYSDPHEFASCEDEYYDQPTGLYALEEEIDFELKTVPRRIKDKIHDLLKNIPDNRPRLIKDDIKLHKTIKEFINKYGEEIEDE